MGKPTQDETLKRAARFVEALSTAQMTLEVVAAALGGNVSTIHSYKVGKIPSADRGLAIAEILGIDLNWWINGVGSAQNTTPTVVYVPFLGSKTGEAISFSTGLIEQLNRPADSLFCTFAVGSMMAPKIPPNAELLCSKAVEPLKDGCAYVIRIGDYEVVRRLRIKPSGKIEALCDNPQVQLEKPEEISAENVVGEVLWVSHLPQG